MRSEEEERRENSEKGKMSDVWSKNGGKMAVSIVFESGVNCGRCFDHEWR